MFKRKSRETLLNLLFTESDDNFKVPERNASAPARGENYELATHTIKVRRTGTLSDVMAIWDLPGTSAVSGSAECHLEGDKSRFQRMPSVDSFNQVNYILDNLEAK